MPSTLTPFEGLDVVQAAIEIPNAAGGLRDAMKIEPREFHKGDVVHVVLECEVGKIRFDPVDKEEPAGEQARVHVFHAIRATFVDGDLVTQQLDEQAERIQRAKEAAEGVERLPTTDELERQHALGQHADGLRDGCPECDQESEAAAAGD